MILGSLPFAEAPFADLGSDTVVADAHEHDHEFGSPALTFIPSVQRPEFGWEGSNVHIDLDEWIFSFERGWESDGPGLFVEYPSRERDRLVIAGRTSSERRISAPATKRRFSASPADY